ncbi:inosine-uridine nucleoside N-ribohydrolase [Arthrobacter sp. PvP023]|uniref:nucleoside hydrolase n=1 Tax=Micrococcaceae TaxID=1268 RepID=UPI001AE87A83|nr:nucleoside hydrolase [Arthrobacter sp. PvP023]MBP1136697.1 inosine-uridine nucleoside N-ribohydrolase [Arthrobacter sp. PvP023]
MHSVLMDVDTGIDDALALVYLLSRPDVRLQAITCTAGNVGARQVALNNLALLELCGRSGVEVAIGAEVPLEIPLVTTEETHGPQGIGYAELPPPAQQISARHAVDVWVDEVRKHPGEITGLITGPLTNFALALRREPELPQLLKGLVIMGGCFYYQGNTTPTAEWNVSVDPHAAKEVFAAYRGLPEDRLPVVCALETTELIEMRPEHLQRLAEAAGTGPELVLPDQPEGLRSSSGSPLVACLSDAIRFYMEFHRLYDQGFVAHVHDAFAACVAVGRTEYTARLATVDVETGSPLLVGTTVADYRGLWGLPPNARIVTSNNPKQCFDELISSVGALARRLA